MDEHEQPQKIDDSKEVPGEASPERTQTELKELFSSDTYVGRVVMDDDQELVRSIDVIGGLRERYGRENVIVSQINIDPDTELLGKTEGRLGIWVDTAAKNKVDNEQS